MALPADPVRAEDGFVYDRSAIEKWVAQNKMSPKTFNPMSGNFIPDQERRDAVQRLWASIKLKFDSESSSSRKSLQRTVDIDSGLSDGAPEGAEEEPTWLKDAEAGLVHDFSAQWGATGFQTTENGSLLLPVEPKKIEVTITVEDAAAERERAKTNGVSRAQFVAEPPFGIRLIARAPHPSTRFLTHDLHSSCGSMTSQRSSAQSLRTSTLCAPTFKCSSRAGCHRRSS